MQDRRVDPAPPLRASLAVADPSRPQIHPDSGRSWTPLAVAQIAERDGPRLVALAARILGDERSAAAIVRGCLMSMESTPLPVNALRSGPVQDWLTATVHERAIATARQRRGADPAPPRLRAIGHEMSDAVGSGHAIGVRDEVLGAFSLLTEQERCVIGLIYFDGFSQAEAARRLGESLLTVQDRCVAALRHLSRIMMGDGSAA